MKGRGGTLGKLVESAAQGEAPPNPVQVVH